MEKFYSLLACTILWFIACRLDLMVYPDANTANYAGWMITECIFVYYTIKFYREAKQQ